MADFSRIVGQMLKGGGLSVIIFVLTLLFSIPLGILVASLRMSKIKVVSALTGGYINIMRGTPLILQLLFFYFGPSYLFINVAFFKVIYTRFFALIFAMSLNYAAYFAEIFRGGYTSIPLGLFEAGKILGFSKKQIFFEISLPLTIKRILPSFAGEVITLVKDTALASVLGVSELFRVAQTSTSRIFSVYPLIIAGVFYFIFNSIVSEFFKYAENKLSYYR